MSTLTELSIRKLPNPDKGSVKHHDDTLRGFGVRCTARSKAFFVMYGEDRRLKTLGKWPELSLKEARQAAKKILANPLPQPAQVKRIKISEARDAFLADCRRRLRPTTVERYYYSLREVRDGKLDSISARVEDPNQLKALKAMYNWCIDQGLTDRNPFMRKKVRFGVRDRLLSDDELAAIWQVEQPVYSDIVKLLVLTGQRRNQIWKFDPSWVKDDALTFPRTIMKTNRVHSIPVTGYGQYLPDQPFSFNGWSKCKARLDRLSGVENWVLHDIRRYVSSTMARIGVPLPVTEQLLDHRSEVTGVAAIYNRYSFFKEMKEALLEYERHVLTVVKS